MEPSSQDRNLPASDRKLQKARDEGQVARSRDLIHLAVLGGGALCMVWLAPLIYDHILNEFILQMRFDAQTLRDPEAPFQRLGAVTSVGLTICVVFGGLVSAAVIASSIASGGWVMSLKPLMPDFSRLNPFSGLGRMFTKDKATEVAKMCFIAGMILYIGFHYLSNGMETLGSMVLMPSGQAISLLTDWLTHGASLMLLVVLVVAMVDVPLQNFLHKSRMKMSHQEMKEEHKQSEGNPQMKGRLRQRQRDIAHGNSISAVPKADFVLMNPTHYAVAIRYDDKTMNAPRVISKGADLLAFKIRDMAKDHAIPVLQSPVLARALYAHAEIDQEIPSSLYTAVAQVLAYIYRLKAAMRGDGPMPGDAPVPFVPPELDPHSKVVAASTETP